MRSHALDSRRRGTGAGIDTLVLDARHGVRARPWRTHPGMAHLVSADHTWSPPPADVRRWLRELADRGFQVVRTGALADDAIPAFLAAGFHVEQSLALLRTDPCRRHPHRRGSAAPTPPIRTRRLDLDHLADLAVIDRAAFGDNWGIDAAGIADACTATSAHRLRVVDGAAYAVTGRAGGAGFLQRLAVAPAHQGAGLGRALVADALGWLRLRRVHTAMVNTHTDNHAALALYTSMGFERLSGELHVLRCPLDAPTVARTVAR